MSRCLSSAPSSPCLIFFFFFFFFFFYFFFFSPIWKQSAHIRRDKLCLPHHILEEKGLVKVSITVQALVDEASSPSPPLLPNSPC
ncbi:hypothetical protein INR49_027009 [Caranx melampygus]|nr:hypothetical protein INR49_027009 [Caranx melampygus]